MVFDFIPNEFEVWIWITLVGGILAWMTHQAHCSRQQRKRTWRIERGLVLALKLIARNTKRAHPNEPDIIEEAENLEKFVNVVLKAEDAEENDPFSLFK